MIPHSSLCKRVEFSVPSSWDELSQVQLRQVIMLMFIYQHEPDGFRTVKWWALQRFCGFRFLNRKDDGWLCSTEDGDYFLMAHDILPEMLKAVEWLDHPEEMTVRIEHIGKFEAADFLLRDFPFGEYLQTENYYTSFLNTQDGKYLEKIGRLLYHAEDAEGFHFGSYLPLSVFLWYSAVKKRFGTQFSHFLKPPGEVQSSGGMNQYEMVNAQIRLLTHGDVTKNEQILKIPTWDALTELDAQAKEAEELKDKRHD